MAKRDPEWEPPEPTGVLSERLLEGAELEAERDRVEHVWRWRPSKVRVRDLRCEDGRVVREWTYI